MEVYRIVLVKWSKKLSASGNAARWNSSGKQMIYTAATRALPCLENIVHRRGKGSNDLFKIMVINIPTQIKPDRIELSELPDRWFETNNYEACRKLGDLWIRNQSSGVLRVPSAIIFNEFNFLINPAHPEFKKIKVVRTEDFRFDPRIKLS